MQRVLLAALTMWGIVSTPAYAESDARHAAAQTSSSVAVHDDFPADPNRRIWFRQLKAMPADIKTIGLHIEVEDAPVMSSRITALFTQAGYTMVPADKAAYRYLIRGTYQSDGKIKTNLPVGKVLEAAVTASQPQGTEGSDSSGAKRAGDVAFAAVLTDHVLKTGLTTPLWASGDLLNAVLTATGLRDSVNTALTGDRRGLCLVGCTYWDWTEQRAGLSWYDPRSADPRSVSMVDVGVFAKGFFVEELATLALNEFLRYHGVLQTTEPATEPQMPLSQFMNVSTGRAKATIRMLEP